MYSMIVFCVGVCGVLRGVVVCGFVVWVFFLCVWCCVGFFCCLFKLLLFLLNFQRGQQGHFRSSKPLGGTVQNPTTSNIWPLSLHPGICVVSKAFCKLLCTKEIK